MSDNGYVPGPVWTREQSNYCRHMAANYADQGKPIEALHWFLGAVLGNEPDATFIVDMLERAIDLKVTEALEKSDV